MLLLSTFQTFTTTPKFQSSYNICSKCSSSHYSLCVLPAFVSLNATTACVLFLVCYQQRHDLCPQLRISFSFANHHTLSTPCNPKKRKLGQTTALFLSLYLPSQFPFKSSDTLPECGGASSCSCHIRQRVSKGTLFRYTGKSCSSKYM